MLALIDEIESANTSRIDPFGLLVEAAGHEGRDLRELPGPALRAAVEAHGLVVLRGFGRLSREAFIQQAATLGEIYPWEFGAVLDLVAHEEPKNYLFANGSVPLHWDGAFREAAPSLQFFQCIRAPLPGTGGETQFCDTTRVIARAPPAQRALWESISITYSTEKIAHYGGSFTARLVSRHPRTGRPTLRLGLPNDEETAPQNPVHIRVEGMSAADGEALISGLRELLYRPEHCYAHVWRDGDFLIADNHALVHGRRAFAAHSPRHLQRIHLR